MAKRAVYLSKSHLLIMGSTHHQDTNLPDLTGRPVCDIYSRPHYSLLTHSLLDVLDGPL